MLSSFFFFLSFFFFCLFCLLFFVSFRLFFPVLVSLFLALFLLHRLYSVSPGFGCELGTSRYIHILRQLGGKTTRVFRRSGGRKTPSVCERKSPSLMIGRGSIHAGPARPTGVLCVLRGITFRDRGWCAVCASVCACFFFFRSRFCSGIFFVFFLLLAFFARGTVASGSEGRVEFDHICVKINERH